MSELDETVIHDFLVKVILPFLENNDPTMEVDNVLEVIMAHEERLSLNGYFGANEDDTASENSRFWTPSDFGELSDSILADIIEFEGDYVLSDCGGGSDDDSFVRLAAVDTRHAMLNRGNKARNEPQQQNEPKCDPVEPKGASDPELLEPSLKNYSVNDEDESSQSTP